LFAKQDTELVLETEDGPYPVSLGSGELLRLVEFVLERLLVDHLAFNAVNVVFDQAQHV
jgi:hypothetical protein